MSELYRLSLCWTMTLLQITCDSLELSELETVGELHLSLVRILFNLKPQKSKTTVFSICKANIMLHHYKVHRLYQH